jgi:hypothetical protein
MSFMGGPPAGVPAPEVQALLDLARREDAAFVSMGRGGALSRLGDYAGLTARTPPPQRGPDGAQRQGLSFPLEGAS